MFDSRFVGACAVSKDLQGFDEEWSFGSTVTSADIKGLGDALHARNWTRRVSLQHRIDPGHCFRVVGKRSKCWYVGVRRNRYWDCPVDAAARSAAHTKEGNSNEKAIDGIWKHHG